MPEDTAQRIVAIGECMVEVSDRTDNCRLGFGGDTLNTALYLARLGMAVDYVTVLGDDPYSDAMVAAWQAEGIGVRFVARAAGRLPGLYAIRTDPRGERRFHYWRDRAPARELLTDAHASGVTEALAQADLVYLSGITVSILDDVQRRRLLGLLEAVRGRGKSVAFDPNYRPAGWPDAAGARNWFDAFYRLSTHALPSIDDERALHPGLAAQELAARLRGLGVGEVVVKEGGEGCWIDVGEGLKHVPVAANPVCVDSTAAGDSFNAGYLAARLRGAAPEAAAQAAHRLAGAVVAHRGAIIPLDAMPIAPETQGT
ncbi:MAG TPA: sugar kinase [Aestuariivirgaceae bacterium]|nr:sugar kinase [Aestuariivirgaceae bacterium]